MPKHVTLVVSKVAVQLTYLIWHNLYLECWTTACDRFFMVQNLCCIIWWLSRWFNVIGSRWHNNTENWRKSFWLCSGMERGKYLKIFVSWDVIPSCLTERHQCCHSGSLLELSFVFHWTSWRYITEDKTVQCCSYLLPWEPKISCWNTCGQSSLWLRTGML